MRVDVGSFTKATATGNQDITIPVDLTGAAAGTWAILFWTSHGGGASGTWTSYGGGGIGFVANGGGSISQYAVSVLMADNAATTNTSRAVSANAIAYVNQGGTALEYAADFVSFPTATSMRINWATNVASTHSINYVIISGLTGAKVVNWTTPTTNTTKAVTGVGFSPDLVLSAGVHSTTLAAAATSAFSYGAFNKHGQQWANGLYVEDAAAATSAARLQRTDACIAFPDADPDAVMTLAHFSSMDPSDGFVIAQSVGVGSALQMISLCMDGVSSKIGAFNHLASTTGVQTIPSRQGFTPKAALFSMIGSAPAAAPAASALWSLGATDLTNQKAVALTDVDAADPTQADSVWYSNASLVNPAGAGASTGYLGTVSAVSADDFTVNASVNSSIAEEFLYLLLGDAGTDTYPTTIDDGFTTFGTAYSNQKKVAELPSGRQLVLVHSSADGLVYVSDDDGETFTFATNGQVLGAINGSIAAYNDGSDRVALVWKQSGTGGGRVSGSVYAAVGTIAGTTITWGTAVEVNSNSLSNYPDVVAHAEGAGGYVHVIFNYATAGNAIPYYRSSSVSGTTMTQNAAVALGTYSTSLHTMASLTIDPATKRLHAAWTSGAASAGNGVRYRTAAYSAGPTWTWATEVEVDTGHYIVNTSGWVVCRWDGTRIVIGARVYTGAQTDLRSYESTDLTTFTTRPMLNALTTTNDFLYGGFGVDADTGDMYFFGVGYAGGDYIAMIKWDRSSGLGSREHLDASYTATPYVNVCQVTDGLALVYSHGAASPMTMKYDRLSFAELISYGQRWPRGNW